MATDGKGRDASPFLAALRDFAAAIPQGSWFAACGEALTPSEREDAASYLAALGMTACGIAAVPGWREAAQTAQRPDWSREWWEAEAAAQSALHAIAMRGLGEAPLLGALTAVTEAADALHGRAALAMARMGVADAALARVAAGAAAQACHHNALALAAGAGPDHLFSAKFRLFAAGRWPLAVVGERFFVF